MPAGAVVAVLGANVAQRKRTTRQRRRDESAGPAIALDEQVFVFLETKDGVSDETRLLIGLAQQERILPVQLIELGAQRNGAVHRVAVLRARTSVDGDRPVLIAGQDTYGHVCIRRKKIGFPERELGNPIILAEDSRRHPAGIPFDCAIT